jgi:hypothetical protein
MLGAVCAVKAVTHHPGEAVEIASYFGLHRPPLRRWIAASFRRVSLQDLTPWRPKSGARLLPRARPRLAPA